MENTQRADGKTKRHAGNETFSSDIKYSAARSRVIFPTVGLAGFCVATVCPAVQPHARKIKEESKNARNKDSCSLPIPYLRATRLLN